MNLETKITIYKFTPQLFTLTRFETPSDNLKLPSRFSKERGVGMILMPALYDFATCPPSLHESDEIKNMPAHKNKILFFIFIKIQLLH